MNLREIKKTCLDKKCQGDVNIYLLNKDPKLETEAHKDPVLVYGNGGNHHKLIGTGWKAGKTKTGQFILHVKEPVKLDHEQHKPAHDLVPGVYLIDRAREKGIFDDMINPVAD